MKKINTFAAGSIIALTPFMTGCNDIKTHTSRVAGDAINGPAEVTRGAGKYRKGQFRTYGLIRNPANTEEKASGRLVRTRPVGNGNIHLGGSIGGGTNEHPNFIAGAGKPLYSGTASTEFTKTPGGKSIRFGYSQGRGDCGKYCKMTDEQLNKALVDNNLAMRQAGSDMNEVRSLTKQRVEIIRARHQGRGNL